MFSGFWTVLSAELPKDYQCPSDTSVFILDHGAGVVHSCRRLCFRRHKLMVNNGVILALQFAS